MRINEVKARKSRPTYEENRPTERECLIDFIKISGRATVSNDEWRSNAVIVFSDLVPETYTGTGQLHAPADQVRPRS